MSEDIKKLIASGKYDEIKALLEQGMDPNQLYHYSTFLGHSLRDSQ